MSILDKLKADEQANKAKAKARYVSVISDIDKADAVELKQLLDTLGYSVSDCQTHTRAIADMRRLKAISDKHLDLETAYMQADKENKDRLARHTQEATDSIVKLNQTLSMLNVCDNAVRDLAELQRQYDYLM